LQLAQVLGHEKHRAGLFQNIGSDGQPEWIPADDVQDRAPCGARNFALLEKSLRFILGPRRQLPASGETRPRRVEAQSR
jgi:hypothetical protein